MAAIINPRDIKLQSETRTQAIVLPPDIGISGNVTGNIDGSTINGQPITNIVSNANDGYTAFQDTVDFRVAGAPSNLPALGAITSSNSSVGSRDIKLTWTYTQGAIQADQFIIYYLEGTTDPTTSSPVLAVVDGNSREITIPGVPIEKSYRAGIVAARKSSWGVQSTTIVNSWAVNGAAVSINYSVITGGPPASATANFFTTSTSNPTGGANGDAHWNSSTNTMWFRIAGVWTKGGTISASEITVGTLAAARIAASSITSDKLSVSTLSAISANLGSVTAGSITGTSNIDIAGTAKFQGTVTSGGVNYCGVFNDGATIAGGLLAKGIDAGGFGVHGRIVSGSVSSVGAKGQNTGGRGVEGSATTGVGVYATATTGTALSVVGTMTITSTTLVTNLNAELWNGCTNGAVGTGAATANFVSTNKPGSTSNNSWWTVNIGGTTRYIPVWT